MNNKWVMGIVGVVAILIVGGLVWNSLRSPEAEKLDQSTQDIIKKRCEINPRLPECKK